MSYYILQTEKPFEKTTVSVRDSFVGNNKLWTSSDGRILLHHAIKGHGLLREIGLSPGENVSIPEWSQEYILAVFRHFFEKGQISYIEFDIDSDDDEFLNEFEPLQELIRKRRNRNEQADTEKAVSLFEHLLTDVLMYYPRYFKLDLGEISVNLYMNGSVHVIFPRSDSEKIVMGLYQTLFSLMNETVEWQEIALIEKAKMAHPLQKSHAVLKTLYGVAGEEARQLLNMNEAEFKQLKQLLLEEMKPYQEKTIYR